MNISTLDLALALPPHSLDAVLSFDQPASLDRADVLIWNPAGLYPALEAACERTDPPVLGVGASEWLLATSRHWREQFKRLLAAGGTLVALVPAPRTVGVHTLQDILPYDWSDPLWPRRVRSQPIDGAALPRQAGEPFRTLFTEAARCFQPCATLAEAPGAGILEDGQGMTLASYASEPQDEAGAALFLQELRRCIERLGQRSGVRLAGWLDLQRGPADEQLHARRAQCLRERHALDLELQELDRGMAERDFFKQLLAGEGLGAGLAAAEVFRRKSAPVHADWVEKDLHIVELDQRNLLLKVRLADEPLDAAALRRLEEARVRVADYFSRPTSILVADCADNALPPSARAPRRHAVLEGLDDAYVLNGLHLYGWHLETSGDSPDRLLQRLMQADADLSDSLLRATLRGLTPPADA
jgi:hypothetical protein